MQNLPRNLPTLVFFDCTFSRGFWQNILSWLKWNRDVLPWEREKGNGH